MKAFIEIGGQKVHILWADIEDYGNYCHDSRAILLRSEMQGDALNTVTTLRHEAMHAALAISGVGFGLTEDQEEQIVRCMETIFFPAWEHLMAQGYKWGREAEKKKRRTKAVSTQRKRTRRAKTWKES